MRSKVFVMPMYGYKVNFEYFALPWTSLITQTDFFSSRNLMIKTAITLHMS